MDFRQTTQPGSRPNSAPQAPVNAPHSAIKNTLPSLTLLRVLNGVMLFSVAILVLAIAIMFTRSNSNNEDKFVSTGQYQAVFLNNGQVYFGHINSLNRTYFQLSSIFYLTQGSTATANGQATADGSYTLVKLGCQQIHDPFDQMLINRDQVTFWENLQDSGKVVTSIKQFQKQNPKGPDCSQVSNQTQASNTTGTQGGSAATGTSTPGATNKTTP